MKKPKIDTSLITEQVTSALPNIARDLLNGMTAGVDSSDAPPPPSSSERVGSPKPELPPPTGAPAIAAPPPAPPTAHSAPSDPSGTLAEKLLKLAELRQQGLLTDEEFTAAKRSLL